MIHTNGNISLDRKVMTLHNPRNEMIKRRMIQQVDCIKSTIVTRRGLRGWCCCPSCVSTDKTSGVRLSRVKYVTVRKIPDAMTEQMEVVRNHKYNRALRY